MQKNIEKDAKRIEKMLTKVDMGNSYDRIRSYTTVYDGLPNLPIVIVIVIVTVIHSSQGKESNHII
jgi:hypothetical protein